LPEETQESPKKETVSEVRERLNAEKEEAEAGEPEVEECPVPSCGREVKSVAHHIRYMAGKGERAHLEWKETQGAAAYPSAQAFSPGVGDALVGMLLSAVHQKRPDLVIPEGWKERAAEAHQKVLERYLGPWLGQRSDLVYLFFVWGELLTVNLAEYSFSGEDQSVHPVGPETEIPEMPVIEPDAKRPAAS